MFQQSLILCKHGIIRKENTILNLFYYIHVVDVPTNKGANSYKLKPLKIGIVYSTNNKVKGDGTPDLYHSSIKKELLCE